MTTVTSSSRIITAAQAQAGQWLTYNNPRMNQRIVEVSDTREGRVCVHADYGNGGEPATLFFDASDKIRVSDNNA